MRLLIGGTDFKEACLENLKDTKKQLKMKLVVNSER